MTLDVGKYRGRDLADVPTDYLEWALGHLALSDAMAVTRFVARHRPRR